MGVITAVERKIDKGPECPFIFMTTLGKYKELKFIQRMDGDTIKLYPRDMLTWSDLVAYKSVTGQQITMLESEVIMGIDAAFEGRDDD